MQLDDRMKQLLRELGHAINDSVSDSERIAEAISSVRAAGFDIVLKLDATIGLARRQASGRENDDRRIGASWSRCTSRWTSSRSKKNRCESKLEMTAQDIKFLKSLKISFDEEA